MSRTRSTAGRTAPLTGHAPDVGLESAPLASDTSSDWLARRGSGRLAADLRDELLRAMRAGDFPDGRLPPEAQLAENLGVSRHSVRAALQSLADDGIVTRRRRHGTVIN